MRWIGSGKLDALLECPKERILVFDTETTGTNPEIDEILQLSIINGNGEVLYSSYLKPVVRKRWDEAAKVNGITPEMVKDAPTFSQVKEQIQALFQKAELVAGYNVEFDIRFIKAQGIYLRKGSRTFDVMKEFADLRKIPDSWGRGNKWFKLTECAEFFGYAFDAHDALEDTGATLHCFNCLKENGKYQDMVNTLISVPTYRTIAETQTNRERAGFQPNRFRLGLLLLVLGMVLIFITGNTGGNTVGTILAVVGIVLLVRNRKTKKKSQ